MIEPEEEGIGLDDISFDDVLDGGNPGGGGDGSGVTAEERHKARDVSEMLPGLGEGFVIAVLRHYGMRTEVVVNALLEGTLPSSLDELSRDLKVPPQRGGNAAAAPAVPPRRPARSSVFRPRPSRRFEAVI